MASLVVCPAFADKTVAAGETLNNYSALSNETVQVYGTTDKLSLSKTAEANVHNGGIVNNTRVSYSKAKLNVNSGGVANDTTVDNGTFTVNSGGVANDTTVNDGGFKVNAGGSANNTTVNSGGLISGSGTIDGLTLNRGAIFSFNTGTTVINATQEGKEVSIIDGVATGFVVNPRSGFSVLEGHTANDLTLNTGLSLNNNNTNFNGLTINKDGKLYFYYTGNSNSVTNITNAVVNSGGQIGGGSYYYADYYGIYNIDGLEIKDGGSYSFETSDTIKNANIFGKEASIIDGVATGLVVNSGSNLKVLGGHTANDITVNSGGFIESTDAGTIDGLTLNERAKFDFGTNITVKNATQEGKEVSIIDGVAKGFTLRSGSYLEVLAADSAYDIIINGGRLDGDMGSTIKNSLLLSGMIETSGKIYDTIITGGGINLIGNGFAENTIVNGGNFASNNAFNTVVNEGGSVSGSFNGLSLNEGAKFNFSTNDRIVNAMQEGKEVSIIDGVATGFVVNSGSALEVRGAANDITVNSSGLIVSYIGTIDGLTLNEGARFDLDTYARVKNATQEGKEVSIVDGVATDFVVNAGSELSVLEGHTANNTIVDGGTLTLHDRGVANNTTVNSGGKISFYGSYSSSFTSTIDGLTLNEGAKFDFSTNATVKNATQEGKEVSIIDGVATGFVVNAGSELSVRDGHTANDITYNSGSLFLDSGSTVNDLTLNTGLTLNDNNTNFNGLTINENGKLYLGSSSYNTNITNAVVNSGGRIGDSYYNGIYNIDGLEIKDGGSYYFDTSDTIKNANIFGKEASIVDGVATGFVINSGANLKVLEGHTVNDLTLNTGLKLETNNTNFNGLTINENGNLYSYFSSYNTNITNAVVNSGGQIGSSHSNDVYNIDGLEIKDGGSYSFDTSDTIKNANIFGKEASIIDWVATGFVVNSGSELSVSDAANDITVNSGGRISGSGTIDGLTLNEGARFDFSTYTTVKNATQEGKEVSIIDGVATGFVVNSGARLYMYKGHTANDLTLNTGLTLNDNNTNFNGLTINENGKLYFYNSSSYANYITNITNAVVNSGGQIGYSNYNGVYNIDGLEIKDGGSYYFDTSDTIKNANIFGKEASIIDGAATGFVVNAGSALSMLGGHTANDITVNSGGFIESTDAGTIDGLTLNEGAKFRFSTDATVINATQEGKEVSIIDGVAKDFVVNSDSTLSVREGHTANDLTLNTGLELNTNNTNFNGLTINENGKLYFASNTSNVTNITNAVVNSGGQIGSYSGIYNIDGLEIKDGGSYSFDTSDTIKNANIFGKEASIIDGVATGFVVNSGANLKVLGGHTANDTTLNTGGSLILNSGSTVNDLTLNTNLRLDNNNTNFNGLTINENGKLYLSSSYTNITNAVVNSGGQIGSSNYYGVYNIDGLEIKDGGSYYFETSDTIKNANIFGKEASIIDGVATGFVIDSGANLKVLEGHMVNDLTINQNGSLDISTGSVINDLTINNADIAITTSINGLTLNGGVLNISKSGEVSDLVYKSGEFVNNGMINGLSGDLGKLGKALENKSFISRLTHSFEGQDFEGKSGAIVNMGKLEVVNSNFSNNIARAENADAGGAIYNIGLLNIKADGQTSRFSGNKVVYTDEDGASKQRAAAVFLGNGGKLTLEAVRGGKIVFDDGIVAIDGRTYSEEAVVERAQMMQQEKAPLVKDGDNYVAIDGAEFKVAANDGMIVANMYEGTYMSKDAFNNLPIQEFLEQLKQSDPDIFSYEQTADGKFVVEQKQSETEALEMTLVPDQNGGAFALAKQKIFATPDMYGYNLEKYVKEMADQDPDNISYYKIKDGHFIVKQTGSSGMAMVMEFIENESKDGAWMTRGENEMSAPIQELGVSSVEQFKAMIGEVIESGQIAGMFIGDNQDVLIGDMGGGQIMVYNLAPSGFVKDGAYIDEDVAEQIFADAVANGAKIETLADGSVLINNGKAGELMKGETGYFLIEKDDTQFISQKNDTTKLAFMGDGTGKIEINKDIENIGTIEVEKTTVDVKAKGFDRVSISRDGVVNLLGGYEISDIIVKPTGELNVGSGARIRSTMLVGGTLNVYGTAQGTYINEGGVMNVASNAIAKNTSVNEGGTLNAREKALLINLLAADNAELNLDKDTTLNGDIQIAAGAKLGGSFDYNSIFEKQETNSGSLTLEGGINQDLDKDVLVNEAENKSLILTKGDFVVGGENQKVDGWNELSVVDNSTVKLAGNINMADKNKDVNIEFGSSLDLAGNSPLIATITGSVNNDGHMNFHHEDDDADDITTIKGNYKAFKNATMTVDINPVEGTADKLVIEGDVEGTTNVTIYKVTDGETTDMLMFIDSPNDNLDTGAYFKVARVYRQAVDETDKWKSIFKDGAWYLTSATTDTGDKSDGYGDAGSDDSLDVVAPDGGYNSGDDADAGELVGGGNSGMDEGVVDGGNNPSNPVNPNQPNKPKPNTPKVKTKVYAETLGYMALPSVGLEQIRDLHKVVSTKVGSIKYGCKGCAENPLNSAWVDMGQRKADLEAPVDVEAKINAVDLGFDVQSDPYNRLGVFASYRQGNYELSGEGQDYYSKTASEYNIDSWALGLYHRYDRRHLWTMASVFGGLQQVDLTTDDGVSADTDGLMFGANIEAGMVFEPKRRLTLEPSIRLGYNFIKYDDMSDRYGKTAEYDNISNLEAELGVKIEKSWIFGRRGIAKLFVKPSVIQNMGKGDVNITSLDAVEGIDNQTLLRGEIGMSIAGDNGLSGFAIIGHTFGSDYKSTDFNAGLGYSW